MSRPRSVGRLLSAMALSALLGAALGACRRPVTEVVLRLDTDMSSPDELSSVRITVTRGGALLQDFEYDVCPAGHHSLPGDVGFVAIDSNEPQPLVFRITPMIGRSTQF